MTHTLFLSSAEISMLVHKVGLHPLMDELIERFHKACREFNPRECEIPARTGFHYTDPHSGLVEWMPLMMRGDRILLKMVGYHPDNPSVHRLPTILCTLALFDAATGHLCAVADGTLLTALRTGAASAVASRLLAHRDSRVLGLIGAGAQAVTQCHAISRVYPLDEVHVYDLDFGRAESFKQRVALLGLDSQVTAHPSLDTLVREADIICTATSVQPGAGPVFSANGTKPAVHVNAVGSDFPGKIEVPKDLLERSFVCPDFREQVEREGECQQLNHADIGPELLDVAKAPEEYSTQRDRPTVFDSTGFALEDYVALELLLDLADQHEIGTKVAFASIPEDPFHPYQFLENAIPAAKPMSQARDPKDPANRSVAP